LNRAEKELTGNAANDKVTKQTAEKNFRDAALAFVAAYRAALAGAFHAA
jgi:hypothetical protein